MGGRTLPYECKHGWTVDYGDFGPCDGYCDENHPGESCPNYSPCPRCESERHRSGLSAELVADLWDRGWKLVPRKDES